MILVARNRSARVTKTALKTASGMILAGMLFTAPAALADPVKFDIPPQNLATALNAFANQAHIQVTVAPGLETRQSAGVSGTLEPADALRQLIGPQLSAEFIDPTTVVIKMPDKSSAAGPRPAAVRQEDGEIAEVVVTARRREEKVQSIPLAVTVFNQTAIEKHQIKEIRDLVRYVPSIGAQSNQSDANAPFSNILRLRGLPGTEIYFAEVPLGNADYQIGTGLQHGLSDGNLYDLEDVEIVKGPQGTLFGKNSVGGLISIQPKKPTNQFEGYFRTTFGNYGNKENEFAVNIPIVEDKLLVRAAGQMQQRDGYTQNLLTGKDLDNKDYYAWRIGVTLKPTDDFQNYLLYDGYWQHTNGTGTIVSFINPGFQFAPGVTLGPTPNSYAFYPDLIKNFNKQRAAGVRAVVGDDLQGIGKDYFYGFTDIATWDISESLTLKNIAAARVYKQLATDDMSPIGNHILYLGIPGNNQQWSNNEAQYTEEIQLHGK
ncbi:MAG TPA: TonB-dependent receptor plug domain-containing protein, partial [Alphaproteobacteria bacterium]|nr:TonB-dependent receptor plug domain-containing protein [Alphaproteobacteria bacterium]